MSIQQNILLISMLVQHETIKSKRNIISHYSRPYELLLPQIYLFIASKQSPRNVTLSVLFLFFCDVWEPFTIFINANSPLSTSRFDTIKYSAS